jgi:hypothetical protein
MHLIYCLPMMIVLWKDMQTAVASPSPSEATITGLRVSPEQLSFERFDEYATISISNPSTNSMRPMIVYITPSESFIKVSAQEVSVSAQTETR